MTVKGRGWILGIGFDLLFFKREKLCFVCVFVVLYVCGGRDTQNPKFY